MRLTRRQLAEKAALTAADLMVVWRCRRDCNRFGMAYQIAFVRLLNRFPKQSPLELLDELVTFTSVQLKLDAALLDEYQQRQPTISEHQQRVAEHLQLRSFGSAEAALLEEFVFEESLRLEQTAALQARARDFLKEHGILSPAESRIARIVGEQRRRAREHIFEKVTAGLPPDVVHKLDELLEVPAGETSELQRLKANPSKPSVESMLAVVRKLRVLEATGILGVDLSWLNSNYQRALYHHVRKSSAHRLRELTPPRRRASMVCFLWQSYRDAVDQAVDMFDKLITRTHTQAKNELAEQMGRQRKTIQSSLAALKSLGSIILDETIRDAELRSMLFEQVPREELELRLGELEEWVGGKRSDAFYGVVRRHGTLRKFSPALLEVLDLADESDPENDCFRALQTLRGLNQDGKRKLPADTPTDFVPRRLQSIVGTGESINRHAWECAVLAQLREEIRSGNVSVKHSKRFGRLEDFFVSPELWSARRAEFFDRAKLPRDSRQVADYLGHRMGRAYDRFLESAPTNSYAVVDEKGWRLSTDTAEKLDSDADARLTQLKTWLAHQMRKIRLPDLLIEVDNALGFTRHFLSPAQRKTATPDDICLTLAAVVAHGCNIGAHTMARMTAGVSYEQIKRVGDWQLTPEAQRSALAVVVSAISSLDTSLYWGEGRTSASDGQRFAMRRRVLQQTYSTKFSDFALEFYSFVADNYAPFYSTPIECTDRDAAFVLDGLLYNESELDLEEHYTDTHGYTEINFAAFAMLGRRFCPRIRGVQRQRLYRIDRERNYGALASLVDRADRTVDPRLIAEQWDRMGHFYASLESGHTTASVALKRLAGYSARNRFYRANRDLGRLLKTEFILEYMSETELRGRVRRGLLKVEQLHALARDVFYGRRSRISAREVWGQMNSCSCLTLIVACIIYWQAREISRAIRHGQPEETGVDLSLLRHVSPIGWDNVVIYGQYVLDPRRIGPRRAVA